MEVSSLFKPNVTQELISTMIRSMLFAAYADIIEVKEESIVVRGCVCDNLMTFTAETKLVYPTTKQVQVAFRPEVGDKVLVIGLQAYNDGMFTSDVPIINTEDTKIQHYTLLGCIAVPLNLESEKPVLRVSDGDYKIGSKDAHGITINEGDDPVVRWSELNNVLESLWKVYNCHYHGSEGANPPSNLWETNVIPTPGTPQPVPAGLFSDLASDVLAVPKASTGGA